MSQNPPRPGLIEDPTEHSLRILDELADINRSVCRTLLAQAMTGDGDTVRSLLDHAMLTREYRKTIAFRDRIKAQAARRARQNPQT